MSLIVIAIVLILAVSAWIVLVMVSPLSHRHPMQRAVQEPRARIRGALNGPASNRHATV